MNENENVWACPECDHEMYYLKTKCDFCDSLPPHPIFLFQQYLATCEKDYKNLQEDAGEQITDLTLEISSLRRELRKWKKNYLQGGRNMNDLYLFDDDDVTLNFRRGWKIWVAQDNNGELLLRVFFDAPDTVIGSIPTKLMGNGIGTRYVILPPE